MTVDLGYQDSIYHHQKIPTTNPIKTFREMEGLSQVEMAKLAGVSRHFLLRAEQGCYNEIPNSILDVIMARGYNRIWALDSYFDFQFKTRRNNFGVLVPDYFTEERRREQEENLDRLRFGVPSQGHEYREEEIHSVHGRKDRNRNLPVGEPPKHPFIQWREASGIDSTVKIATLYCVHPTTLHNYEKKSVEKSTPNQLLDALEESGYSMKELLRLAAVYKKYRAWKFEN